MLKKIFYFSLGLASLLVENFDELARAGEKRYNEQSRTSRPVGQNSVGHTSSTAEPVAETTDIDVNGARQILDRYPHSVTIFIMPPTFETLAQRLKSRGTDSDEIITKRLKNAKTEIAQKDFYKHIVVNDSLPEAIEMLSAIISENQIR